MLLTSNKCHVFSTLWINITHLEDQLATFHIENKNKLSLFIIFNKEKHLFSIQFNEAQLCAPEKNVFTPQ